MSWGADELASWQVGGLKSWEVGELGSWELGSWWGGVDGGGVGEFGSWEGELVSLGIESWWVSELMSWWIWEFVSWELVGELMSWLGSWWVGWGVDEFVSWEVVGELMSWGVISRLLCLQVERAFQIVFCLTITYSGCMRFTTPEFCQYSTRAFLCPCISW